MSAFGNECEDRQNQPPLQHTGGKILSFLLANNLHVLDQHLKSPSDQYMRLDMAYDGLEASFANVKFTGTVGADAACQEVLFGALALYGLDQVDKAEKYWLSFHQKTNSQRL